jgi:hypothetical protein
MCELVKIGSVPSCYYDCLQLFGPTITPAYNKLPIHKSDSWSTLVGVIAGSHSELDDITLRCCIS